jgi:hypothetical protein
MDSYAMYIDSATKQLPTILRANRSLRARSISFLSTAIRQSSATPAVISMQLSSPKPTREMLPTKLIRRTMEVPTEMLDRVDVNLDCGLGVVAAP